MDAVIRVPMAAPIAHGHRIEVVHRSDEDGARTVIAVTDLDDRVRYQPVAGGPVGVTMPEEDATGRTTRWTGHVVDCTIVGRGTDVVTELLVDPVGSGAAEADLALREADAAAEAARGEALRWGGADRTPKQDAPRFW